MQEFSFRIRAEALRRFREETFDLLVIGGGITGAGVARDAASRGLRVAVVEKNDFAYGTSSRSSKLIHGGLRYLQNFEFGLVFEALSERALLLKTTPHLVRPLKFYLPVYEGDSHGRGILTLGLWLYDLLALFRAPGFHKSLSRKRLLHEIPFLKERGLRGGFHYYDASMWDDVMAVETLRAASGLGVAVANYTEAREANWEGERITGFRVKDLEAGEEILVRARKTIVCAGPWTDQVGPALSPKWRAWLKPSKGVHLLFDLKRIPIPGAMVMSHPEDGRISFVIPRPDFGQGVVIVGTTDGPTPKEPEKAEVDPADVEYLLDLLNRYFPKLELKTSDILSAYVGVRPLMGDLHDDSGTEGQDQTRVAKSLQKVSREHHIDHGPGGTVVVAGGKYTTHRRMAEEIVDFTLESWAREGGLPPAVRAPSTKTPINPATQPQAISAALVEASRQGAQIPAELLSRYGAEALEVMKLSRADDPRRATPSESASQALPTADPAGFPFLAAQLRYAIRYEMVIHLEDFYLRRAPLYAARADEGMPWAEVLAQVWAEERGLAPDSVRGELARLRKELSSRSAWKNRFKEK